MLAGMATTLSALDPEAMARARALVERSEKPQSLWPVLGAAAMLAISTVAFATAMIAAPPLTSEHPAQERGAE
jgi:hypothetical protein